jgi:ATP-binding cassette subfamily F protein 3
MQAEERQARSKERKQQQQLVHELEKEVTRLEAKQAELTAELEKPETYQEPGKAMQVNRELTNVLENLSKTTRDWETAATKLAEVEAA